MRRQQPDETQHISNILASLLCPKSYASTWLDYNLGASHQLAWHLCTLLFSLNRGSRYGPLNIC
jgi:hypothetical protein